MAQLYVIADRLFGLVIRTLVTLSQGVWLGLLNRSTLQKVGFLQYGRWQHYQSDTHNLSGLFDWETHAIDQYFFNCHSILLGAAGGGREVVALAQRGLDVTAFECQPLLLSNSQRLLDAEHLQANLILAKPDQIPEDAGIYDGLIMGWGGYIHIVGHEARIQFLRQFRSHICPGGPILLSFFVRKADSRTMRWTFIVANVVRRLRLSKEPVELGDLLDSTFDHYFTEDEIRAELEAAGFEMLVFNAKPFGHAVGRAV